MKKQVNVSIRQFLCYTLQFWSLQMLIHLLVMTPIIPTFGLMYEPLALFHGGLLGVGVLLSSAIAYFSAGNRGWKEPLHGVAMVYIHAALYFVVAVGLQVLFIINNHLPFSGNVLGVTLLRSGALLIFVILTCVVFHFGAGKRRHRAKAGEQKETITFDVPPLPRPRRKMHPLHQSPSP